MYNQLFNFNSEEDNRFPIPSEGLKMTIDQSSGELVVELGTENDPRFNLNKENGTTKWAIFVRSGEVDHVEIGQSDFGNHPLSKSSYQLNKSKKRYEFNFQTGDDLRLSVGHLGILDIRDVSAKAVLVTTYFWDRVPILLEVEGNVLHIKTVEYEGDLGLDPWYVKHKPGK